MKKKLSEADIIQMMREEWDNKVRKLSEDVDIVFKTKLDGKDVSVMDNASDLKVKHKSKLKYTIDSVGPRDVILRNPEGEKFIVSNEELEKDYTLE